MKLTVLPDIFQIRTLPHIQPLAHNVPHSTMTAMDDSDLIRQAMSSLAKRRWAGLTADERREAMRLVQAARKPLTPEQRAERGRRLAAGRAAARAKRQAD